jgi:hypothetical protein
MRGRISSMTTIFTPTQQAAWEEDGYLHIPGLLTPAETERLQEWVAEISSWPAEAGKWMHHFEQTPSGPQLARSEYLTAFHGGLRRLLMEGKLSEVAEELLGEPVRLYKEKINYKYAGGGGYRAHQDAPAYEFVKNHITCSVAVDRATTENGCLFFAAGWHRRGLLHLDDRGCIAPDFAATLPWRPLPMEPGDAVFFSSFAPHLSPPNNTDDARRALYVTYNAASEGDWRESYYEDKRRSLAAVHDSAGGLMRISKIDHFEGKPARVLMKGSRDE